MAWADCGNQLCCNPRHTLTGTQADLGEWQRRTGALEGNIKTITAAKANGRARSKITLEIAREIRASPLPLRAEALRVLETHGIAISHTMVSNVRIGKRWAEPNPFAAMFMAYQPRTRELEAVA